MLPLSVCAKLYSFSTVDCRNAKLWRTIKTCCLIVYFTIRAVDFTQRMRTKLLTQCYIYVRHTIIFTWLCKKYVKNRDVHNNIFENLDYINNYLRSVDFNVQYLTVQIVYIMYTGWCLQKEFAYTMEMGLRYHFRPTFAHKETVLLLVVITYAVLVSCSLRINTALLSVQFLYTLCRIYESIVCVC